MKVKISDRQTEGKIKRWLSGELGIFNKSELNANINDVDYLLLKNRGVVYYDMIWIDDSYDSFGTDY